jgi:ubiquinone/menaquinone biosynthesis C-methylase UbiE
MNIADIGAGTGYFAIPLARAVGPHGKIYAVDLQHEMLNLLGKKLEQPDIPRNIELLEGDASNTTLASKCVDLVLIANVWHELDDRKAALRETARILRSNGALAILDWRPDMSSPPGPPAGHRLAAADVVQFLLEIDWTASPPINIGRYSYFVAARPPHG